MTPRKVKPHATAKPARSIGRPSAFRPEYVEQARALTPLGATDSDLANTFGVTPRTIQTWKTSHPEFLHALKGGKAEADLTVTGSLFQRARGYEWDEEVPIKLKTVLYDNGKRLSETETIEMRTVHRVVPPDTTACIFWLKNRRKDVWRDRQEHTGQDGGPIEHEVKQVWTFGSQKVVF